MSDFIGEDAEDIRYELEKAGYEVEIKERESDEVKTGLIIKTIPSAGSVIEKGDRIVLLMSVGVKEEENPQENETDENDPNPDNNVGNEGGETSGNEGSGNAGNETTNPPSGTTNPITQPKPPVSDNPYEGL